MNYQKSSKYMLGAPFTNNNNSDPEGYSTTAYAAIASLLQDHEGSAPALHGFLCWTVHGVILIWLVRDGTPMTDDYRGHSTQGVAEPRLVLCIPFPTSVFHWLRPIFERHAKDCSTHLLSFPCTQCYKTGKTSQIKYGLTYIAVIQPSLNLLMIGSVWTAMLVPIGVALWFFSTAALRRKPIFIMNVISLLIGLAEGILSGYVEVTAILSPKSPIGSGTFTAFMCLCFLGPIFVESILLLRLWAVFPPRQITWTQRIIVYVPPVVIKLARLANGIVFTVQWQKQITNVGNPVQAGQTLWGTVPWAKIEWFMQTFDNLYASILFIWRLKGNGIMGGSAATSSRRDRRSSYASMLKALFWISVSNFVFPVMLSLTQLIFVFRDPNYLDGAYVFLVNNYVEIIGVLLATVWAAGVHWVDGPEPNTQGTMSLPHFAAPTEVDMINTAHGRTDRMDGRNGNHMESKPGREGSEPDSDIALGGMDGNVSKEQTQFGGVSMHLMPSEAESMLAV